MNFRTKTVAEAKQNESFCGVNQYKVWGWGGGGKNQVATRHTKKLIINKNMKFAAF